MKRIFVWYLMLNKRLLKKTGFLIILFLIPILALLMTLCVQKEDSGFLNIAIYQGNNPESTSQKMLEAFDNEESDLFKYTVCSSEEEAVGMVTSSKADMAWVFADDLTKEVERLVNGAANTLVTVYEKEETTVLKLSREKIYATLYPFICYEIYNDYIDEELNLKEVPKEQRKEMYDFYEEEYSLVEFRTFGKETDPSAKGNYLTSPIKGMVSVLILLCGLASTMYFIADDNAGTFSRLRSCNRLLVMWVSNFCALSFAAVFATLAFILSNNYTSFGRETLIMILYILITASFCTLMGALIPSQKGFAVLIPALLVACMVFCPIFINLSSHVMLQNLFPPYHYLYSLTQPSRAYKMIIYFAASSLAAFAVYLFRHRREN